jgi:hypothetical protein
VLLSSVYLILSGIYLGIVDNEWISGKCKVLDVSWKDDLYQGAWNFARQDVDKPVSAHRKRTSEIVDDDEETSTKRLVHESNAGGNNNGSASNTPASGPIEYVTLEDENYTRVGVRGLLYKVNFYYKGMFLRTAIRDPTTSKILPPLYKVGQVYECVSLIEKLVQETTLQKDVYRSAGENDGGYVWGEPPNEVEEDVFFIAATHWPAVNGYHAGHANSEIVRRALIGVSLVVIFVCCVAAKIYWDHYRNNPARPDFHDVSYKPEDGDVDLSA